MNEAVSEQEQAGKKPAAKFQPGISGNPAGRPRRHDPANLLREALFRRLAAEAPEDMRRLYRDVWGAGDVETVADALAVEVTRLGSDGPPELVALARLLEAVRE